MTTHETLTALAPRAEALEPEWSQATLREILADDRHNPWWRTTRRRSVALVAGGVVALTAGTAVAVGGPAQVVKDALLDFSRQPNTTGNGLGVLHDPELVAKFRTPGGVFAFWVATSSRGRVCFALSSGWDGVGAPTRDELSYGCGGTVGDPTNPDRDVALTRPDQLGGFFKDSAGPLVYGVSPYPDAVQVRVRAPGVDRTLPVRAASHGFGAAVPEATQVRAVRVTFLDRDGQRLGSRRLVAPVG